LDSRLRVSFAGPTDLTQDTMRLSPPNVHSVVPQFQVAAISHKLSVSWLVRESENRMQRSLINSNCGFAGVPAHLRLGTQKRCCRVRQFRACLPPCWSRKSTTYFCFLPNEPDRSKGHSSSMVSRGGTAVKGTGTLSVLTLNIWGLWLVSKRRAERVKWVQKAPLYCSSCSCCLFTNLACQLARESPPFRTTMQACGLVTL